MDDTPLIERRQPNRRQYNGARLGYAGVCSLFVVLSIGTIALASPDQTQSSTSSDLAAQPFAALDAPAASNQTAASSQTATRAETDAVTTTQPSEPSIPSTPAEVQGFEALEQIDFPWRDRLSGWTIEFHPERSGYFGLTNVTDKRIDIYVREGQSPELLTHVIAHELGHAFDVTYNDADDRDRWKAARQIEDASWWPDNAASDFATGAGDFAESFAYWQTGGTEFRSAIQNEPTPEQLAVLTDIVG